MMVWFKTLPQSLGSVPLVLIFMYLCHNFLMMTSPFVLSVSQGISVIAAFDFDIFAITETVKSHMSLMFLEIDSVHISVCMCMCLCVSPEGINNQ